MSNEINLKTVLTCLLIAFPFFIIGYIAGLSIPDHVEFGLDQKTLDYLQTINLTETSNTNCTNNYNITGCTEKYLMYQDIGYSDCLNKYNIIEWTDGTYTMMNDTYNTYTGE
jgi:hypothetical protein